MGISQNHGRADGQRPMCQSKAYTELSVSSRLHFVFIHILKFQFELSDLLDHHSP